MGYAAETSEDEKCVYCSLQACVFLSLSLFCSCPSGCYYFILFSYFCLPLPLLLFFVYSYCKHNEVFPSFDQCLLFLLATRTILRRQTLNEIFRGYGHISGVIGYEKRTRRRHIGSIHVSLHFFPFE